MDFRWLWNYSQFEEKNFGPWEDDQLNSINRTPKAKAKPILRVKPRTVLTSNQNNRQFIKTNQNFRSHSQKKYRSSKISQANISELIKQNGDTLIRLKTQPLEYQSKTTKFNNFLKTLNKPRSHSGKNRNQNKSSVQIKKITIAIPKNKSNKHFIPTLQNRTTQEQTSYTFAFFKKPCKLKKRSQRKHSIKISKKLFS